CPGNPARRYGFGSRLGNVIPCSVGLSTELRSLRATSARSDQYLTTGVLCRSCTRHGRSRSAASQATPSQQRRTLGSTRTQRVDDIRTQTHTSTSFGQFNSRTVTPFSIHIASE